MNIEESQKRFETAEKLLSEETTTVEKVESIFVLLRGIHPKIEKVLDPAAQAFINFKRLQEGNVVELVAGNLPVQTQDQKKRKKALLLFIKTFKELQSEVKRVKKELESGEASGNQVSSFAKIAAYAKGPFGIVTIVAVLIGVFLMYTNTKSKTSQNQTIVQASQGPKSKIEAIQFQHKIIPLSELENRSGPDCDSPHYHAKNHASVKSIDGETIEDPGACAYGKVNEVQIIEVDQ